MNDPVSEWDPSIAALIAQAVEAFNVCELWLVNCQPTCDLPNPKPLPVLREARAKLESAASALRGVRVTTDQEDQKPTRVDEA